MMNLEIRKVADNATDEERVVLYALADCNLNGICYLIQHTMKMAISQISIVTCMFFQTCK